MGLQGLWLVEVWRPRGRGGGKVVVNGYRPEKVMLTRLCQMRVRRSRGWWG